jgi:hypothetical protein
MSKIKDKKIRWILKKKIMKIARLKKIQDSKKTYRETKKNNRREKITEEKKKITKNTKKEMIT